jgi:DNA polymerase-3 subunit epsilon
MLPDDLFLHAVPAARLCFAAIDFETANPMRGSACAVGVVRVEGGRIVERFHSLICPPQRWFTFSELHGLSWEDVRDAPTFRGLWPRLGPLLEGVDFLAAHNAPFDRSVLRACCEQNNLQAPAQEFFCTLQLARRRWGLNPARLPDVARHLGLELAHHHALSDAEACARILLSACAPLAGARQILR